MNYSMTAAVSYHILCLTTWRLLCRSSLRALFCLLTCAAGAEVSCAPRGWHTWGGESLEGLVKD